MEKCLKNCWQISCWLYKYSQITFVSYSVGRCFQFVYTLPILKHYVGRNGRSPTHLSHQMAEGLTLLLSAHIPKVSLLVKLFSSKQTLVKKKKKNHCCSQTDRITKLLLLYPKKKKKRLEVVDYFLLGQMFFVIIPWLLSSSLGLLVMLMKANKFS